MRIPPHTRIILIPEDTQNAREYGISRRMTITLVVLTLVAFVMLGFLLVALMREHDERVRIETLEADLRQARTEIQTADRLRHELEQMSFLQEKLLFMLGIEDVPASSADSLDMWLRRDPGSAQEAMRRSAAVTLSPKPDLWPASGFVTREFEKGRPAEGVRKHLGIDIAGPRDRPLLAAGPGEVFRTGEDPSLGIFVEIQHGLGYLTVYGHCARLAVGQGDKVVRGQVVAYMGKSGQASATHLHFEVYHQGEAIDPRQLLAGDPPQE